jgi:GT2 family glycosyltransferase
VSGSVELSLIIPTCADRGAKLRALLTGIASSTVDPACYEVLVVVDAEDETPLGAAEVLPRAVRFVGLAQPHAGPAAARNRAIAQAQGRWLLILNDDALVDADTVAGHLRCIRPNPTAAVAYLGRFDWPERLLESPWRRLLAQTSMVFFWDQMQAERTYGFRHFWTNNLSVRTELVRAVGGFNAGLPYALHEDIELGWRLERRFGLRVQPVPSIRAWHDHAITPRDYFVREHRAGEAARRARTLNSEFFNAVWGRWGDGEGMYAALSGLFAGPGREVRALLDRWATPSNRQPTDDELRAVYLAHLPLKRLVFCQGFTGRAFDDGTRAEEALPAAIGCKAKDLPC